MKAILAALALVIACALATPAQAQAVCGDRSRIMATLAKNYAERPAAIALTSDGAVIEVLTSRVGTWSILVTAPGGPTCLVAGGENWEPIPLPLPQAVRTPARFQPIAHLGCVSLDEVLDKLFKRWGETLAGVGKSSDRFGRDLGVFFTTSPEGAYSMFAVRDGCAYFVSGGEAWRWLREDAK